MKFKLKITLLRHGTVFYKLFSKYVNIYKLFSKYYFQYTYLNIIFLRIW